MGPVGALTKGIGAGLLGLFLVTLVSAPESAARSKSADQITYFYKNPNQDTVPAIIEGMLARGELEKSSTIPPIVGFLAGLFLQDPEWAERITGKRLSPKAQWLVGNGLVLAGMRQRARAFAKKNRWRQKALNKVLAQPGDLLTMEIKSPTHLDFLWGASFATGDATFVDRIIGKIEEGVDSGVFELEDILLASQMGRAGAPDLKGIAQKYGEAGLRELLVYSVALWAVASNAYQHPFVSRHVDRRINAAEASDLAYALRRVMFRRQSKLVQNAKGQSIDVMVSQAPDREFLELMKDVDGFSEAAKRFKKEFSEGESVHIAVIMMLRTGAKSRFFFEVFEPDGGIYRMGPFSSHKGSGARIDVHALEIDSNRLMNEGIYSVRGTFSDGGGKRITTENQFFVGR